MNICPFCSTSDAQHKIGFNRTGTQRIRCTACRRIYTPHQKHRGYAPDLKKQAVCLYADGLSLRHPGPPPVMLSNWMNCTPLSGTKKTVYLCTAVDRATRCIVGWGVSVERTWETLQAIVDQAPADNYFSDGFNVYPTLLYRQGLHQVAPGKSQTFSVEGVNADLRHSLARLARRSRCFSRCIEALRRAVRLFVFCHNQRQLWKRERPKYPVRFNQPLHALL